MTEQIALTQLADDVLLARQRKTELEATLREINADIREAEGALAHAMRESDIDGFKAHGKSFAVASKLSVRKTDEDDLFDWLEQNGYGATVKRTIHHATLTKVANETLTDTGALPAGIEAQFFDQVSIRKA